VVELESGADDDARHARLLPADSTGGGAIRR
jgi:hypothetical protein